MKRILFCLSLCALFASNLNAQSGTEFWFAPPEVTFSHNSPGGVPIYLNLSTFGDPATVTIDQPANPGFTPIVVAIPANSSSQQDLSAFVADLETEPTNTVLNTGLRITATDTITAYYEVSNTNNTDIFSLKGQNSLGTEFYIPLHNHAGFYNHTFASPHEAYASFDIVATEDNTSVMIYSPQDVDGHTALTPFTIVLDQGQTYSCGWTGTNYTQPSTHPSGAVVVSDKNVAITIKDDSNHNPSGGCYDLFGDQIVPVNIVGTDYIAVKGQLNNTGDESVFITATQNNTQVFIDGAGAPITTLFAGQTYRYDIDYLATSADNSVFVQTSKSAYVTHVTGFGCEGGQAILPPLGCAGSEQTSFTRSTAESFFLNILVRATAVNDFTITGPGTATINPADFQIVPGTGGVWMAAQIQYNTTEIPVNQAHLISNSSDVFSLAIINGGASSGCRYGFFSEFAAEVITDAGVDFTICANDTAQLVGSVTGGTTTGEWTGNGSGQFIPNSTTLNARYVPSANDISAGNVTLTLTSTGNCFPVSDNVLLNITPAPTVDAGPDVSVCANNADVTLTGAVTIASGGIWSGGAGTYAPNSTSLNTVYTPTAAEIASGSVILTLTTTGNGTCYPESDIIVINFTPAPTVDAGANLSACSNNADAGLTGSLTVATGGIWSGGAGTFSPNVNALAPTYTPTAGELASGNVSLTLTSTGNGTCNAVSDVVTVTYTPSPTVDAGPDQTLCANNADATLAGSVTLSTGGEWSGGLGTFTPDNTTLNATYTPTAVEIASGTLTLTLTTTGNGNCNAEMDQVTLNFTAAPTADAGTDVSVCANNPDVTLAGAVTIATGGQWSGGTGTFSPNANTLTATYTPSAAEITAGTVTLTLTTTGNGTCNAVTDDIEITITPAPTVDAGTDISVCSNNADAVLNGSITVATGGLWSGGAGTFSPNVNALGATYTPSAAELSAGNVTLTLTSTGNGTCNAVADAVTVTYTASPTVSAGPDQTLCENNPLASLAGSVTLSTGGEWSGGLGTFVPDNTALNATYSPAASEIASGSVTLSLTTTGNGNCNAESDQVTLSFTAAPTVDAGIDQTVCASSPAVTLNGAVTIATGGQWSGGGGTFAPNANTLNATYTPSAAEIAAGTVTLTLTTTGNGNCIAVVDDMVITIEANPISNAGPNLTSCQNNAAVNLAGTVTNATGGIWSGGGGSYNASSTDLNAVYTPSAAEIAAGNVTLTLTTTTGGGTCADDADDVLITIVASPTANAGADQTICSNNADITLNGSVTGASGGTWSGGLGTFNPSNTALNAVYSPTATEIAAGNLTLTLTTTGIGSCIAVTDDMDVTFTTAPTADAGIDLDACANNPSVTLNGSITIATGGVWSGGSGTFNPSNTDLGAVYTPSTAEITAGTVTLTLTTTGNGNCLAVTDDVDIVINPTPVVNAGSDQTVCVDNLSIALSGSVSGVTNTGQWSTGGSGFFTPNNTTLNATYVASSADSIVGNVTLYLTSTNNGSCLPVVDSLLIDILPAGTADAGPDVTVCSNNATINLSGAIGGAATVGTWTTNGTGVFVPDNTTLNGVYVPSPADKANGSVTITLDANSCNNASDNFVITVTSEPVVDAGADQIVCASNLSIPIAGSVSGPSTTGQWTTLGSGTFGNASDLNTTYFASAADSTAQSVTLILEATGIGTCLPVSDTMVISIFQTGIVDAGNDQILCGNNGDAPLMGMISGGASSGIWSTSGSGTFIPNDTTLNATYQPSIADTLNGSVDLALTATNSCNAATDFVTITYTNAPYVDAGPDQAICGTNPNVALSGMVTGASGAVWSTAGTGTFSPNVTDPNATYQASAADVLNGSILIQYTSIGNGTCNATVDDVLITITTGISVNAGPDQTVCSTAGYTVMPGIVSNGSTTGVWTTLGTGTFMPNDSLLNAEYHFSNADTTVGSVQLILTSTNNGTCSAESDTVTITFGNSAYAYAGADQVVCANSMLTQLSGVVTGGASQGQWTSSGSGTFIPNDTDLNAFYDPSPTDSANGFVQIILSTTDHGSCAIGRDTMDLTIEMLPQVDAGTDIQICSSVDSIPLSGAVVNAPGGIWSTSGTGSFSPNNTDLSAHYIPSFADLAAGTITIYLSSSGSAICAPVQDSIEIELVTALFVQFSNSPACVGQTMSFSDNSTAFFGTITGWVWDFGDGDSSNAQNPVHIYANSGTVNVTLTVSSSLGCEYTLIRSIVVNPKPIVSASYTPADPNVGEAVQFNNLSLGTVAWNWYFGDGFGVSNNENPSYTYIVPGIYTVVFTATDAEGCQDSAQLGIQILEANQFPPVVPTGFSPNGDGDNDELFVRGGPFESVFFQVYNNWGNVIFETQDETIGWDGTWKGKEQPTGDYIYVLRATLTDGTEYSFSGSVSIIR